MRMLFQDVGEITELNGYECESLLCIQVVDDLDKSISPGVFWLKIHNGKWHRFFIDSSFPLLSWTEYDELDQSDLEDQEDYPVLDVGKEFNLAGYQIMEIKMSQVKKETLVEGCLEIQFSNGRILKHTCSESGSNLTIS